MTDQVDGTIVRIQGRIVRTSLGKDVCVSDFNRDSNRAVWFDIPVVDLDRATSFYSAVLAVKVKKQSFDGFHFSVIEHRDGNGGCCDCGILPQRLGARCRPRRPTYAILTSSSRSDGASP